MPSPAALVLAAVAVLLTVLPPSAARSDAPSWRSVKLEEFEAHGFELIGQDVEILGDYDSLLPISPRTAANIVDPRMSLGRKALSDPSLMRLLRGVDPSRLPRVALDLSQTPDETFQWFLQNQCREHCEGVYFRGRVARHRVSQMPALLLVEASRDSRAGTSPASSSEPPPGPKGPAPSAASGKQAPAGGGAREGDARGPALLFAAGAGPLTAEEQRAIFEALGLAVAPDGKGLLDDACLQPVGPVVEFVDLNGDAVQEVFVTYGNTCVSGATGSSIVLFVKGRDGRYTPTLGFPAAAWKALPARSHGFPDLQTSGMGFCDGVQRWNGTSYEHLRNQPTARGGCREVDGTP